MALKRLFANGRLFVRDPDYAKKYDDVVQDYIRSGHELRRFKHQLRGTSLTLELTTEKKYESSSTEQQSVKARP